jgi:hypothetical protein
MILRKGILKKREEIRTWYCAAVPQFANLAGSEMRAFKPCAPNAPSMTLEAPKRVPIVQKGIVTFKAWDVRYGWDGGGA